MNKEFKEVAELLKKLEQQYGCTFSYLDNDVKNLTISFLKKPTSLEDYISLLERNTPLTFTSLSKNDYAISLSTVPKQICGRVLSAEDQKPLANVKIQLQNTIVYTDSTGTFFLTTNTWDASLQIETIGFNQKSVAVKKFLNPVCTVQYLSKNIEFLSPILITNYLTKGLSKNYDGSVSVNYKDFTIVPGQIEPDLLQTLQAIPGVMSANETISDLNIRGGTQDQNLILWDGIKMYQTSHFFGLISAFNPYLTKDIRLYQNGSKAKYGDGVSGVIVMETENSLKDSTEVSVGINMLSMDSYVDTPINSKSSIQITARTSINEFIETPTYSSYFNKSFQNSELVGADDTVFTSDDTFTFYDISTRYLYQITEDDLLKFNFLSIQNDLVFLENAIVNNRKEVKESGLKQQNLAGGVTYIKNWTPKTHTSFMVYGSNYVLEATNSDILNDQRLFQQNEILESGTKLQAQTKLNPKVNLSYGYQFNETGISHLRDLNNPIFRDFSKEVIRSHSFYTELAYLSPNQKTALTAGTRLTKHNKFSTFYTEPRLSLNQKIANRLSFTLAGELKSQITSQIVDFQNDFLGVENRKWVLSNGKDVPVLKSQQLSSGLTYSPGNWILSGEAYYKKVDGILSKSQGFQNQFENSNDHGSYTITGIDLLINKRFKNLNIWLTYSTSNNTYEFNNLSDEKFPNSIDITHNARLALTYFNKKLQYSAGISWHSGRPTTAIDSNNPIVDEEINYLSPNEDNLQDYLRVDGSALYNFKLSRKIRAKAGISFWNITNYSNVINSFYTIDNATDTNNPSVLLSEESGLEFTANAIFRITF
ncbi:TonB-dependent receptor [Aquimarina brevivitae]|uniref:TonB-dependent receptor n=1 Tax=Aquimarina brevivitae TaxID=323412 RepID=UPI001029B7A8|nr:TonB-dependent receptor [Aquimarina brevivitae]